MSLMDLMALLLGKHIDLDGAYGPQCTDLVNAYVERCHELPAIPGDAHDFFTTAPSSKWEQYANGPYNYPHPGDIVVWGASREVGIGVAGHVAVCVMADDMHLLTLDQNWPSGAPVSLVLHTYTGVMGWLRANHA